MHIHYKNRLVDLTNILLYKTYAKNCFRQKSKHDAVLIVNVLWDWLFM